MADKGIRLGVVLQRELSALLHSRYCHECTLLTVTRVSVGEDMTHACVYFSAPDGSAAQDGLAFFLKRQKELKRLLTKKIALRRFPELHFRLDEGQGKELRVQKILDQLSQEEFTP
ncbi:MAG: 30S ribosome-binding factor RbfA [Puniceicoccales bacterium]|jgi:ribosome-binding factor A|nr:30S ribosome-binding factor RbfA [Puniceicoccales bacterium]